MRTRLFVLSFAVLGFLNLASLADEPAKEDVIKVTAQQLSEEFSANPKEAVQKYKGKTLEIEGQVVRELQRSFGTTWQMILVGGKKAKVIACDFDPKGPDFDKAKKLKTKGKTVRIKCLCDGLMNSNPLLKNCTILEVK